MDAITALKDEIRVRMRAGADPDTIDEEVITPTELTDEQKAALWLYAWSYLGSGVQRREAEQMLAAYA